jgi:hypothetical protein
MSQIDALFSEKDKKSKHYYQISTLLENVYQSIKKVNPTFNLDEAISYASNSLFNGSDFNTNGLFHTITMDLSKKT